MDPLGESCQDITKLVSDREEATTLREAEKKETAPLLLWRGERFPYMQLKKVCGPDTLSGLK